MYHSKTRKNIESVKLHLTVVTEYLKTDRAAGPFALLAIAEDHTRRFVVVLKHHHRNKWCLIEDLSHPKVLVLTTVLHAGTFCSIDHHLLQMKWNNLYVSI